MSVLHSMSVIHNLQKLDRIETLVQSWLDKQGHDRCWYYPEIFREIAIILNLKQAMPSSLPSRCDFIEGCSRYQDEEYGALWPPIQPPPVKT